MAKSRLSIVAVSFHSTFIGLQLKQFYGSKVFISPVISSWTSCAFILITVFEPTRFRHGILQFALVRHLIYLTCTQTNRMTDDPKPLPIGLAIISSPALMHSLSDSNPRICSEVMLPSRVTKLNSKTNWLIHHLCFGKSWPFRTQHDMKPSAYTPARKTKCRSPVEYTTLPRFATGLGATS